MQPSGVCQNIDATTGLGRCGNPGGCAPAGELCAVGAESGGTNACGTADTSCAPIAGACTTSGECCTGLCSGSPGTCIVAG